MAIFIGIDLGTTSITALALADAGETVAAVHSMANDTRLVQKDQSAGVPERFEWDADAIFHRAENCLRLLVEELGPRGSDVAAIGVTGQQHGVVLVDARLRPLTPFINWQDRRGDESFAGGRTVVGEAQHRLGADAWRRTGCLLATGHMGLTLFWLREKGILPQEGTACSIMDFVTARLTGGRPVTEPTCAAASGLFDVRSRAWDRAAIDALGLRAEMLPELREAGQQIGKLEPEVAARMRLAAGIPVSAPTGDQQAGFVGSVTDRVQCGHLNVGTGAQLGAFVEGAEFELPMELRPFPIAGNLLTGAVLCGGWSYQVLEQFFRRVGSDVLDVKCGARVYQRLNELAASVPPGSEGLNCEPLFAGTRTDPTRRGLLSGMTAANFTPAHLTRALLEGMAQQYSQQLAAVEAQSGRRLTQLVAAGNALRENRLLCEIVSQQCGLPLVIPKHREEAAFGAALLAAISVGRFANLDEAVSVIQYQPEAQARE